jgi:hypothetical protein
MGLTGLTAVFGMGTGVAPPVSSPGNRPAGGHAAPDASSRDAGRSVTQAAPSRGPRPVVVATSLSPDACLGDDTSGRLCSRRLRPAKRSGGVGVVKPLGC